MLCRSRLSSLLSSALILAAPLAQPAAAQSPEGGQVRSGAASITSDARQTTIRQTSERAVIDWRGFDVGRDHAVRFNQPGARSATLNRIGSGAPSRIDGRITAPGTVIIQNERGVLFGAGARIDVGGLVATTGRADAERFARGGDLRIKGAGRPGARVVNEGSITIGEAGLGALVGRDVENAGTIIARRGTVALASGTETTLDLSGDGTLTVAGEGGHIEQSGLVEVGDGRVLISAGAAAGALDGAINVSGVVRAGSASANGGAIDLTAGGPVRIDGTLDASGIRAGGTLSATGSEVHFDGRARILANGGEGGGSIEIGGEVGGTGPMPRPRTLRVAGGAELAPEGTSGQGGRIVLWSDGDTIVDGRLRAAGGEEGGFVETSARERLAVGTHASVNVGQGGHWLLDPRDVVIADAAGTALPGTNAPTPGTGAFVISRSALATVLNAGSDVTVTTFQPASTADGTITVADPLAWTGSGDLTLRAEADVRIDAPVRSTGDGSFRVDASRDLHLGASVEASGTGGVSLIARVGDISFANARPTDAVVATRSGDLLLEARKGSILLDRSAGATPGNIQVLADSGATRLKAGREIRLRGGNQAGRWVRLGGEASASPVSLNAPTITVQGGTAGNSFAEIVTGAGGAIDVRATDIAVRNGSDQALVQAFGGAPLAMRAERQVWNGPVRAGTGAVNGGEVAVSGAISAGVQPIFNLASGRSFRLEGRTPRNAASSYASTESLVVRTRGTGTVALEAPVAAERILLESREAVELAPTARLTAAADGDALVVAAGRRFTNRGSEGNLSLGEPGARWLLYLDNFDGLDGPVPRERGFDLYGRNYADQPPAAIDYDASRIVYAERPVLRLEAESLRKTYGETAAPGLAASGLRPGDGFETALAGAPSAVSDGAPASARAGRYATRVEADASRQGYLLEAPEGTLVVDRAPLTVRAADARRTYGVADPAFSVAYDGFVLGEGPGDLRGDLVFTTDAAADSRPGSYAVRPGGLESDNYAIAFDTGTLDVGRAPLRVVVRDTATRSGEAPRFEADYLGFVLGESARDLRGELTFATDATEASPPGTYAVAPGGIASDVYDITFESGRLTVLPPSEPSPLPGDPGAPPPLAPPPVALAGLAGANGFDPIRRGAEPLTPGDASFRTTVAEAPPALSAPFALTYSLGEVSSYARTGEPQVQTAAGFVPAAGGAAPAEVEAEGFVPAAGTSAEGEADPDDACGGAVRLADRETCVLVPRDESFWTTREEGFE